MTSKTLWLCCLLLALGTTLHAQSYTKGIGARLGFPAGLSINTDRLSYNLTILAVNHSEVLMENLSLMYGGGGHLGSYDEAFEFGVDGILGLEFVFDGAPIAFSFDIKPALSITTNIQPIVGGAFTLRYVF